MTFDDYRNRTVGTVESVSGREIRVLLDTDAPRNTAINTGLPQVFPKINGYVLIPNEEGSVIGIISWIGIEYSSFPKRRGFKDFDLIDLPFPLRKLSVSPIGVLKRSDESFYVERGVFSYPSVGDSVIIPSDVQLKAIIANRDKNARVKIGTSPMASNEDVFVNPDKLFGRHTAVLGNTGSGKSCSVAGLIRWSIEAAKKKSEKINCRFLVLDPNDEYGSCFDDLGSVRKFKVVIKQDEHSEEIQQLKIPSWMWNSYEWSAITIASDKSQRPLLRKALKEIRNGEIHSSADEKAKFFLNSFRIKLKNMEMKGVDLADFQVRQAFGELLASVQESLIVLMEENLITMRNPMQKVHDCVSSILASHPLNGRGYYPAFSLRDVSLILNVISNYQKEIETFDVNNGPDADTPLFFNNELFVKYMDKLIGENSAASFMDFFMMRVKSLISDIRVSSVISTQNENELTLEEWLDCYIGAENDNGTINVFDLSLLPSEVVYIVVAVFSRMTFEAHQRYRRLNGKVLPSTIVVEEAHNFIKQYADIAEELSATKLCTQSFEKIAKEGRKFGLGLLLSSQRPSELSSTVLSQCNTFLLHRLVNDRDQDIVRRLVPDSLGNVLVELPVLPTRTAILLGWATPIPLLVELTSLAEDKRPKSNDPDFWDVWTCKEKREIHWNEISREWQRNYNETDE